jgi:hypothetical protein
MTEKQLETFETNLQTQQDTIIILKGVYKSGKHTVQPAFDKRINHYRGVERLSEEQKKGRSYFVEPTEIKIELHHNKSIDLSDEIDAINWNWMKHLKEIAGSLRDAQKSPSAMFYVHIEGREALQTVSKKMKVYEATKKIVEDDPSNLKDRALILGEDFSQEHPTNILEWLLTKAEDDPQKIIDVYSSKTQGIKLMYLKAKQKGIVTKSGNAIIYRDEPLGIGDDGAIAFLISTDAKHLVSLMKREVYPELESKPKTTLEAKIAESKPRPAVALEQEQEDAIDSLIKEEEEEVPGPHDTTEVEDEFSDLT